MHVILHVLVVTSVSDPNLRVLPDERFETSTQFLYTYFLNPSRWSGLRRWHKTLGVAPFARCNDRRAVV